MITVQAEFHAASAWRAIKALLDEKLDDVDVDIIADKDFDDNGELIMNGGAVRIAYAGTTWTPLENQGTSYETVHRFMILTAEESARSSEDQAIQSLSLGQRVVSEMAGARLALRSGEVSEPVTLVANETVPARGVGVAYGLGIEVPGPAVFAGKNAQPEGESNAE